MLPNLKQKASLSYSPRDLTTIYFENYTVSCITIAPVEDNSFCFGEVIEKKFYQKTDGTIVTKAWLEIPSIFPQCKLGKYRLKENQFTGIISINNVPSRENSKRLIYEILSSFKARSTKLLNQLHGTHGRIFWQNAFEVVSIEDLNDLNNALFALSNS
jgi:hypothetical protein